MVKRLLIGCSCVLWRDRELEREREKKREICKIKRKVRVKQ